MIIVKAGNPKHITSPNGLKGLNVAVQGGTKYEQYLKALKAKIGFSLQSYPVTPTLSRRCCSAAPTRC